MIGRLKSHPSTITAVLVLATGSALAQPEDPETTSPPPADAATAEGEAREVKQPELDDAEPASTLEASSETGAEAVPQSKDADKVAQEEQDERADEANDNGRSELAPTTDTDASEPEPNQEPASAPAPTPTETETTPKGQPFSFSTSVWSRFEWRENYDALGVSRARFTEGDQTVYRARLGLRSAPVELTDGLQGLVQFTPQASGTYGTAGTIQEHNVGIYEGYFRIGSETASVDAGRFRLNYGDALIIGDLGWHQTARSFDGIRTAIQLGEAQLDLFVTQANAAGGAGAEGHPGIAGSLFAGDSYFYGAYAAFGKMLDEDLAWDVYLLGNSNVTTDGAANPTDPTLPPVTIDGATMGTLGSRVKHAVGILDYRLEAGLQVGERPAVDEAVSTFAYQVDGEIGVKPMSTLRIALAGALASGDDPGTSENEGWAALYATHHKWFGLMDVTGLRTNIASGTFKLAASLTDSLKGKVDAHIFARPEDGGLAQAGEDKLAGYEVDAQLVQKIGKPGTVRGLYGIFLPNEGYYGTSEAAHYVEIQGGLAF